MLKAFIFCILCIGCTIGIVFLIKNYIIPKITQKIEPITVAVGGNGNSIAYSKDGISWSKVEGSDKIFYEANGISFNGKRWVAVGKGFNDYNIAYSDNGINWSPIKDGIFSVLKGVASNGTTWIAVGQGTSSSIAYSNNGIFILQNNQVNKLIPNDIPIEIYTFNNIEFIIDYSSYIFRKDYNIPFEHIVYTIEKNQYKHNINSLISLIVEKNNNKITNIYFETSEKNLNQQLKEDIIKYLSLFNDIKQY